MSNTKISSIHRDPTLQRIVQSQRQSITNIQLNGLFGLGALEVIVIGVAIGVVIGPSKIVEMIRSSGEIAGEYKNEISKIPTEFQKGYEEGQIDAKSRKAKPMKQFDSNNDDETHFWVKGL